MRTDDFLDLVKAYVRTGGQSFIPATDSAGLRAFVSRQMRRYTRKTKCLYDDAVAFTVSVGVANYDLAGSAFAKPMFELQYVVIDKNPLINAVRAGFVSVDELNQFLWTYRTNASRKPAVAAQIPPNTLRLIPAPVSVYTNCYVSGWYLHPDITDEQDDFEIQIPENDIEPCARFCAFELCLPFANGEGLEKIKALAEVLRQDMAETRQDSSRRLGGLSLRGRGEPRIHSLI